MTATILAPAKINLDLRVLGRRADGFHEIRTLLQSVALHDRLSLRSRPGPLVVHSRSPQVPDDRQNIVWRAAKALWAAAERPGEPSGVGITLQKRVPMAAGLGGGSSDAASALRALAHVWRISTDRRQLQRVAAQVGSDVPYFLEGGTALGYGRGERIRRLEELRRWWVVIAQPSFGVSTPDAYRWLDAERARQVTSRRAARLPGGWRDDLDGLANDLQPAVASHHPEIALMVERLRLRGARLAAMTGSGSAVVGLFRRRQAAHAARLAVRRTGWRTVLTRTITRAEFAHMSAVVVLK